MILVSTLRKLVEQDGFVFVSRIPAHKFTLGNQTVDVPAQVELYAKKPTGPVTIYGDIPGATVTKERARAAAHLDPVFDSIWGVKQ